ncbi:MAG: peptide chain release factor N(5)-glutamine methyltransferase [Clostridium sp.]|nr:peptide chain release factor N(5)-glutamine methyltransferase [Clostridium sp.]
MIIRKEETGPTWRELLNQGTEQLLAAGIDEAGLDAWYLLSEAFGIDRVHYYMEQEKPVREERLLKGLGRYREMLTKRASRIPLQQILGNASFMGLTFSVNEHVLIPRQDTEVLAEQVLTDYPGRDITVLDVCTGSGCIAISLAVLGKYRIVCGTDISREALAVANRNARNLFLGQKGVLKGTADHVSDSPWRTDFSVMTEKEERSLVLAESDMFGGIPEGDRFDVIVSNPPYIVSDVIGTLAPEVRDHEPRIALDGSKDGLLFYRILAGEGREHLVSGGRMYLEIGYDQGEAVRGLLLEHGFKNIEVLQDLAGLDRVVRAEYSGNS